MLKNEWWAAAQDGGCITSLVFPDDPHQMNWVAGRRHWGEFLLPPGLEATVTRELTDYGTLREHYSFTNTSSFDLFAATGDVGIYTPLADSYTDARTCMTQRCHTHIWCGHTISYLCALRMGGAGPHLGLVLTRGCLGSYSVERPENSNDRGDFLLHLSPFTLLTGETYELEWELFRFENRDAFHQKLLEFPRYIDITSSKFVYFPGEDVHLSARVGTMPGEICVHRGGMEVPYIIKDNRIDVFDAPEGLGEHVYTFVLDGMKTCARVFVQQPFGQLVQNRCRFIAARQQYDRSGSHLDGAFLTYDNETGDLIYTHALGDQNGGRERIGMGVLLAKYLQWQEDPPVYESLMRYADYVKRELVDVKTGAVYDDVGYCAERLRPYNDPWAAVFFMELFRLSGDGQNLLYLFRILRTHYLEHGGTQFYAIHIPMAQSLTLLREAGLTAEADELKELYLRHGEEIARRGLDYPPHEVNYEQSIVAPAAYYMAQLYEITGDERWRAEAERQLDVLNLFGGKQPDYHLYEVSIRHWDGFWFGKRKLYGDTFPHYWSSLTGNAQYAYYRMTKSASALAAAEASLRASLSLFAPDGSASCAYVYPLRVNGQPGAFADPWANDQDWALYFYMDYLMQEKKLPGRVE